MREIRISQEALEIILVERGWIKEDERIISAHIPSFAPSELLLIVVTK